MSTFSFKTKAFVMEKTVDSKSKTVSRKSDIDEIICVTVHLYQAKYSLVETKQTQLYRAVAYTLTGLAAASTSSSGAIILAFSHFMNSLSFRGNSLIVQKHVQMPSTFVIPQSSGEGRLSKGRYKVTEIMILDKQHPLKVPRVP